MSYVLKKGRGTYVARIGPFAGKRYVQKTLAAATTTEAEREMRLLEVRLAFRRTPKKSDRIRFREARMRYIDEYMPANLKPGTQETYLGSLRLLGEFFDNAFIDAIGLAELANYQKKRSSTPRRQKNGDLFYPSTSTVRGDFLVLSSMMAQCVVWEYVEANIVDAFLRSRRKSKSLRVAEPRTRYLSHREEELLLEAAARYSAGRAAGLPRPKFMLTLLVVAIDTGLRLHELLMMRWSWIVDNRLSVIVPSSVTKNGKSRQVPLLARSQGSIARLLRHATSDVVFHHADGMAYQNWRKPFAAICREAKLEDLEFHDLRRTCGCRLLQDHGMAMDRVSKWLGHSSIVVTERHYAFLSLQNLLDDIDEEAASERRDVALRRLRE